MNPPTKSAGKLKAFLTGMIFGFVAYLFYLNFLTADGTTASAVGWVFFAPQYLIFWAVPQFDLSETVGLVACYTVITLLYGYIALSFRLSPRTAIVTFIFSGLLCMLFLHWQEYLKHNYEVLDFFASLLFWPAIALWGAFDAADVSNHLIRISVECISVAFWYAALICGVRTFFRPIGKPDALPKPPTTYQHSASAPANSPKEEAPRRNMLAGLGYSVGHVAGIVVRNLVRTKDGTNTQSNSLNLVPVQPTNPSYSNGVAVITTTEGTMVIEFWPEVAPKTVENFKALAKMGFYDGTCFYRVIKGFMIQGGDPLTKDPAQEALWGTGGPGYTIKAEFNDRSHVRGVISMARSNDPNSAGSQFFICHGNPTFLDHQYTIFGKLIQGDDVLEKISTTPTHPQDRPDKRIGIESIKIIPANAETNSNPKTTTQSAAYYAVTNKPIKKEILPTGWHVGSCTNTAVGISANMIIAIRGTTNTSLYGDLEIYGDLGGGGPFHGMINDDSFSFTTYRPSDEVVIEWRGKVTGQQLAGTYTVTCDNPEIAADLQHQEGDWSCSFVRSFGNPDPDKINSVWVYDEGKSDGPFTLEEFTQNLNSERWPLKAIITLQDRTVWTTVADYLAQAATGD